jgi:uncharacterized damage-inducible protein DinB
MIRSLHNQLLDYVHYNSWANQLMCDTAQQLTEKQFEQPIISSFPNIRTTILHIWDAQVTWIKRLQGQSPNVFPSKSFVGDQQDILEGWTKSTDQWVDFFHQKDLQVESTCSYADTKGNTYDQTIAEITMHCMNHGTYHRGQLTTLFRQLELESIPQTDYIKYLRTKTKTG